PESLIDSELFGHDKGAFTGAVATKRGRFERAHQGTIFLDEIGELPLQAQVRLLNVIQNQEIERVGGERPISIDVRIISATHRNLEEMVTCGTFREDLWFRLNIFPIMILPLRHRKDDIPELVRHFIQKKSMELKIQPIPPISAESVEQLKLHQWPGNVRELENLVERALILNRGRMQSETLVFDNFATTQQYQVNRNYYQNGKEKNQKVLPLDIAMANYIKNILKTSKGRIHGKGGAADLLGMNPSTLRSRMKKFGIKYNA
ncbi:MAG: sigma-54-dependent Fis family transcriptional regulator, partial [Deltaproteobacteria bacterium]|nr:sigma-54-dependent Fis family transcriptional regulator [Deltaproteobacteria bacterium]